MRYRPDREYEARVPCDRHGTVWAAVVDRWPDGSPLAVACPGCTAEAARRLAAQDPTLADEPAALRDLALDATERLTLTMTPGRGQVRERDALRAAEAGLANDGAGGSVVPNRPTYAGGDDDGE